MKPIVAILSALALVGLAVLWIVSDGVGGGSIGVSPAVSAGAATGGGVMRQESAGSPAASAARGGRHVPDREGGGLAEWGAKKAGVDERWWVPMGPSAFAEQHGRKSSWMRSRVERDGTEGVRSGPEHADAWAAMLVRHFDSDGDGVLNEIERAESEAVMAAKGAEERARIDAWNASLARRLERFDRDGDGRLDLDESYAAYLSDIESKAAWRFRQRYDTNGDAVIDASDLEAFVALFANDDPRADANDDGAVDGRDLEAFEMMMAQRRGP